MHTSKLARPTLLVLATAAITAAAAAAWQPGRDRSPVPGIDPGRTLPRDVAPYEHHLHAYRIDRTTIVLVARGANRTGGYSTHLEWASAPDAKPPEVHLRNVPPGPGTAAPQAITPFDATAHFQADRSVDKVTVIVAGRPEQVQVKPIKEVQPAQEAPKAPGR